MSHPVDFIDLSFQCDPKEDFSLLNLWKLTNNQHVVCKSTSLQRLNNRSWRLSSNTKASNHHLLLKDLSVDSVTPIKPKAYRASTTASSNSNRPSLFLSNSKSTLFSHNSKLSLASKNTNVTPSSTTINYTKNDHDSDTSDISEDDDEDDDFFSSDDEKEDSSSPNVSRTDNNPDKNHSTHLNHIPVPQPDNNPRPSASDLSYGVPPPFLNKTQPQNKPPLNRSRTSFVRGFSPNHVSVSSSSSFGSNRKLLMQSNHSHVIQPSSSQQSRNASQLSRNSSVVSSSHNVLLNNKNIFYLANSPSPEDGVKRKQKSQNRSSLRVPTQEDNASPKSKNNSTDNLHVNRSSSLQLQPPIQRQGSLFSNYQIRSKDDVKADDNASASSTDISDDASISDLDENESGDEQTYENGFVQSSAGTRKLLPQPSIPNSRVSRSEDNDSEWLSVSSESEQMDSSPKEPLQFNKRVPMPVPKAQTRPSLVKIDSESTDIMEDENPKKVIKSRSLLSGMFLNELAASRTGSAPSSRQTSTSKPMLKRSSTTGIITVDQNNDSAEKTKRPSILFSKKHTSMSDIFKNYPHYQNNLVKTRIINDYFSQGDKKEGPPASDDDDSEDESLFAKQKSMVGLSDFNVTTKPSSVKSADSDPKSEKVKPGEVDRSTFLEQSKRSSESLLSSSLSKYSQLSNSHSIKNLLSKSSLGLTNLLSQTKKYPEKYKLPTYLRHAKPEGDHKASNLSESVTKTDSTSSLENVQSNPVTSTPLSVTPIEEVKKEESVKEPEQRKSIRLSPKTTRRSMLASELSSSLKESIILDYKLGKAPLLTKTLKRGDVTDAYDDVDADDYHSKGW